MAKKKRHVVGKDGQVYQLVPVKKPGFFPAVGRFLLKLVTVMGWILLAFYALICLAVKRK